MKELNELLLPAEIELVRRALKATVEGSFFPDWEFETLLGVDRETVRMVYEAWPQRTVGVEQFDCAVIGSINNLVGYPHCKDEELRTFMPEGRAALNDMLDRLNELGILSDFQ